MQVQRFRKPTVREALADVRSTLGPDALVLSTLMVPARGWRRLTGHREVEVTAAPGEPLSESRPDAPVPVPAGRDAMTRRSGPLPRRGPGGQGEPRVGCAEEVVARLVAAGLDRALATEVAAALPPRARRNPSRRQVLDALAARLAPVAAGAEALTGVDVFIGPPGAGKTTTIAKLAAQVRARHGLRPTLVAADGYRVGAVEQLRIYADILGLPFLVARTAADLERAVSLGDRPMLVDTAGRSPADRGIRDLFDVLSGRPGVRTHLVLAAGTGARDLERVFALYEPAGAARVVLSKVDETGSIAAALAAARARRLRVSYIGCGQRVPEDLAAAAADTLAAVMLGDDRQAGALWQDGQSEELCG
jgi:flagellar biosynthesis protein FlhF